MQLYVVERTVRTPDGRTLAVAETGDPAGPAILVHMGSPNSRHLYLPNVADAATRGLRLICYDRPGYGGSTAQPGRSHADCAADVRAICAALLPDLAVGVACLAGLAPFDAEGLDWFDGMGKDNADDFRLLTTDKTASRAKLDEDREQLLAATADDLAGALESLLSPVDAAALTGDLAKYLAFTGHEGLEPGSEGWWEDACAQVGPWGFGLADIKVPVLLMHGREDKFVPFGHGQWLAVRIPGVDARLLDGDGHLTLLRNRVPEVHAWLAERF